MSAWWFDSHRSRLFCFWGAVCFHLFQCFIWRRVVSQPSTSRTWYTRYYTDVRRNIYSMYLYVESFPDAVAAALYRCCRCSSWCCSSSCSRWQKLLLVHWIWSHPRFSSSSFRHDLFLLYVPLGSTVAFTASICQYYTSENVGVRGAKAGVQGGHWLISYMWNKYRTRANGLP